MNFRLREVLKGWLKEAGMLYVLVAVFVGLCFLCKSVPKISSCNPTFSRNPALAGPPQYYGRTP
jgi:hypothetical protein